MKKTISLALISGLLFVASEALAEGFFTEAATRFMNTFKSVRTMVLIFGGFGLIVLAIAAILGKIKWAALGALAAGLAIVAVAGKVVDYATSDNSSDTQALASKYATFSGEMDMQKSN